MGETQCAGCEGGCRGLETSDHYCFVGLFPLDDSGQLDGCCCELGCRPCAVDGGEILNYAARTDGTRWLRPSALSQPRDATGRLHDLRSNDPHRVPTSIVYTRGSCWEQLSQLECHDDPMGLCACDAYPDCDAFGPNCPPGQVICPGVFPDAMWYRGYQWSNAPGNIDCRQTFQISDRDIMLHAGRIHQGMFIRSDYRDPSPNPTEPAIDIEFPVHCTSNRMVLCGAVNPETLDHYLDPHHQMWNYCTVDLSGIRLGFPPGRADDPNIRIRNLVLKILGTLPGADQLDYQPFLFQGADGNGQLDYWARAFQFQSCDAARTDGLVAVWPDCRLRRRDCPITIEAYIESYVLSMSLVFHVELHLSPNLHRRHYPSARFHVRARMGYRISGASQCRDAEYTNPPSCHGFPAVPGDHIEYRDDAGRVIQPPKYVEWYGYHGSYGALPFDAVIFPGSQQARITCCRLAAAATPMEIAGWPTHAVEDPAPGDDPSPLYAGRVVVGFVTSQFCGSCSDIFPELCGQGAPPSPSPSRPEGTWPHPVDEFPEALVRRPRQIDSPSLLL